MAIIQPFRGWLPKPEHADEVACVPYDVINTEEAKELAEGKPNSYLHVIRPEIDLPDGTPFNDDKVYQKGAENLKKLLGSDLFLQDEKPAVYIYQMEVDSHTQTGVYTCASVQDYDNDVILKHELTRPDKEDDRTRHILTQEAHAEPVMLTFRDSEDISFQIEKITITQPPFIEHEGEGGVTHRIWKTFATAEMVKGFADVAKLYIADGHHRCKSASRVAEQLRKERNVFPGEAEFEYFPVVLFPMSQMKILPYNRVIKSVTKEKFNSIKKEYGLIPTDQKEPEQKGAVSIYFDETWWSMKLPAAASQKVSASLDVARLQDGFLNPVFGIENPRTDQNINFVGGIRGTKELEKLVDKGSYDLAISMYPTSIRELLDVSDQGELMPPKSTWFEPKIKSGLIVHTF
ncbi:DUF1015 domain-containing protein [Rhodohalobacter halophilus]|uniref:DUF1015 domain-containing protein n=1 Tax=Rhodohalobacter halophilus TaxID=1812810 RepID=UPI00083F7BA7|nr:DUF1015 family protein [Rhodohalobacter halophilus]